MGWLVSALAVLIVARAGPAVAADDPALLRLFLTDGSSLASYGEPARIGDRVIFSMPTAATPNPPLQLVNLPASRINWERTDNTPSRCAPRATGNRRVNSTTPSLPSG